MFSDDQEERKEALRRYQRPRHLLMPSTYNMDEVDAPFHDFTEAGGVWTDQRPVQEIKLNRCSALHCRAHEDDSKGEHFLPHCLRQD